LGVPSSLLAGQKSSVIGTDPTPAKNENGARFTAPVGEIVETHAIGRGTMPPMSSLYRSAGERSAGSRSMSKRSGAQNRARSVTTGAGGRRESCALRPW
jgi:hypothetical protein